MNLRRLMLLGVASFALVAKDPVAPVFADGKGVAIRGYDTVAYFSDSKPVVGKAEFNFAYQGATWRFASAEHRDLFAKDPAKYAPQYGGYCAWAVSNNYTASIDPMAWKIVEGKLFLNYSLDVQKKWEKEQQARIESANRNWPGLHK